MDGDIHSKVNFCVHESKSLYHIVGATIWATKAPLLCDSRSKLSSWLFDRCSSSIRVETDDLQLLLGFWPCLIHRDGQQSHVHLFPTVRWSWFSPCVHLVYPKQRGWLEVKILSRFVSLVSSFQIACCLHLPSAFHSLFFQLILSKKEFDGRVLESQNLPCNC